MGTHLATTYCIGGPPEMEAVEVVPVRDETNPP